MREGRGVWRLRGLTVWDQERNNYSILLRYMMARFIFFFTLDAGFTLNIPKMITDQLGRDNLSWIETHKTTDCLFRSHSQFFCTFFLPVVPDTYTGMHPNARSARLKFVVTAMEENVDHAYCGFWYAQKVRGWAGMWLSLVKKKHYYSSIQTVAHWYVWLLTLVYSLLYMYELNFGSMFCFVFVVVVVCFQIYIVFSFY